jgi:hypothetical protein
MKKLQETNFRNSLLSLLASSYSVEFIKWALEKYPYCLSVSIDYDEFTRLLVVTEPTTYPTLEEVVRTIREKPGFVQDRLRLGSLDGATIALYIQQFSQGLLLKDTFILIRDKQPDMQVRGSYYVADGRHRLVAYGLWSNMSAESFPLAVFYSTDKIR